MPFTLFFHLGPISKILNFFFFFFRLQYNNQLKRQKTVKQKERGLNLFH